MFYDIFVQLCMQKGVKPGRVAEDCGINRSNVSLWKSKGYTPRGDALNRIAAYFGVSVDYLLGGADGTLTDTDTPPKDEELKFALFGGGDVTDAQFEEVKRFAQFVRERDKDKKGG